MEKEQKILKDTEQYTLLKQRDFMRLRFILFFFFFYSFYHLLLL